MRILLYYIIRYSVTAISLMTLVLLSSCFQNELPYTDAEEYDSVSVQMLLTTRGANIPTVSENPDNGAKTLRIYVFNNNGKVEYTSKYTASSALGIPNPIIKIKPGLKDIYVVLNEGAIEIDNSTNGKSLMAFLNAIVVGSSKTDLTNGLVAWSSIQTTGGNSGLLMTGNIDGLSVENKRSEGNPQKVTINVTHNLAKMNLAIQKHIEAASSIISIKKIELMNGSTQQILFSSDGATNNPQGTAYTLGKVIMDKSGIGGEIITAVQGLSNAPAPNPYVIPTVYIPENIGHTVAEHSNASYLKLTYSLRGEADKSENIYINNAVTSLNRYNVVRNTAYTILVTMTSRGIETEISVVPWAVNEGAGSVNQLPVKGQANSYVIKPTPLSDSSNPYLVQGISIPVKQANADGTIRIGANDRLIAELLWTESPNILSPNGAIAHVGISGQGENAHIRIISGAAESNSVVCVKDTSGVILWSWHIWTTKYDPNIAEGQEKVGTTTYMNRNLGAEAKATTGSADLTIIGLYYQWGRKDPIVRPLRFFMQDVPRPIYGSGSPSFTTASGNSYDLAIKNPTVSYSNWLPNVSAWGSDYEKSAYDPCPSDWKIPTKKMWGSAQATDLTYPNSYYYNVTTPRIYHANDLNSNLWTATVIGTNFSVYTSILNSNSPDGFVETGKREMPLNVRCARIETPPSVTSLSITWQQGVINTKGSVAERSRTTFSALATGGTAPYKYSWLINGKTVTTGANGATYNHSISKYSDQSILLQCVVTDAEGRRAYTPEEYMLMKRPFTDSNLIHTMQNGNEYLKAAELDINANGGSRVRYLRDERDNIIYRVKFMKNKRWYMVSDLLYINGLTMNSQYWQDNSKTPEGTVLYHKDIFNNVCPFGWETPLQEDYIGATGLFIGLTNADNPTYRTYYWGQDESNADHYEAQANGYYSGGGAQYPANYAVYRIQDTNRVIISENDIFQYLTDPTQSGHSVRCIKKK